MRAFGETLRQARLERGIALADAERETRIRRHYLEALEAEDIASLPPPVYTRGFIQTYAEFLGLNPRAVVDLYEPAPRQEQEQARLRPAFPHVAIPRDLPVRPIAYVVIAVLAFALLAYLWTQYQQAAAVIREQEGIPAVRPGAPSPPGRIPTINPLVALSPSPAAAPSVTATPSPTPTPAASPTPVTDGILLEFRTTAQVYVEATVDGALALAETLPAGTQRTLPLAKSIVVMRVSNGSALQVTVNGKSQEAASSVAPVEFTWQR